MNYRRRKQRPSYSSSSTTTFKERNWVPYPTQFFPHLGTPPQTRPNKSKQTKGNAVYFEITATKTGWAGGTSGEPPSERPSGSRGAGFGGRSWRTPGSVCRPALPWSGGHPSWSFPNRWCLIASQYLLHANWRRHPEHALAGSTSTIKKKEENIRKLDQGGGKKRWGQTERNKRKSTVHGGKAKERRNHS